MGAVVGNYCFTEEGLLLHGKSTEQFSQGRWELMS